MRRCGLFAGCVTLLSLVCDGWSSKPSPLVHQILLLPFCALLGYVLFRMLRDATVLSADAGPGVCRLPLWWVRYLLLIELWSACLLLAEARHFRSFGYFVHPWTGSLGAMVVVVVWAWFFKRASARSLMTAVLVSSGTGMLLAIRSFPLNYLRSDMLPVIGWADGRILQHLNPYGTMHVGSRVYDFPYLPGMLVAFWPAAVLHADLRWATLGYLLTAAWLVIWAARKERRFETAGLLGAFLLCPFLQYRHDLYLQPHWFTLVLAAVLMQRGRFLWSALIWGVSCAIYQLSWVMFPFFVLNAYRRRGIWEALKVLTVASGGALLVGGPFLRSASNRIASNTVGQWSRLPHALADPINVSYWLTYLIRPDHLKWVQASVLVGLFGFCWVWHSCRTVADTLRWMCCALALFIPLNVIVDGYFYLTLALMLLLFICVANGWWVTEEEIRQSRGELVGVAQPPEALLAP